MQNANVLGYNVAAGANVQQQISQVQQRNNSSSQAENINGPQERSFTQPLIVDETKQYMDGLVPEDEDEDQDSNNNKKQLRTLIEGEGAKKLNNKKTRGRVKIKMEFIQNKLRRYTTFSKRKTGIMKKAYELSTLTGTQVMLLVASETGHVYTFATRKLQPMITSESGKALIQTCLNSPDPSPTATVQQIQQNDATSALQQTSPAGISVANVTRTALSQNAMEEGELQYQSQENKTSTTSSSLGAINYVNQSGQSFPMTAYITPAVTQNQTTIFTPSGNTTQQNSATVQIQAAPTVVSPPQPQILSGQLQLHRIHPQNILLTGSSPVLQSNHIILNQTNNGQPVVLDSSQTVQTSRHASSQQDVITLVNPELSSSSRLQMVYSPGPNTVIYAPTSTGTAIKRGDGVPTSNDIVTLQHTPVIQTPPITQENSNG